MASGLEALTAVILAGGKGTRLRSVVADRNKVAATVRGRPFLAHLLDQLSEAGFRQVIFSTGYMGAQIRSELGDSHGALRLSYFQETEPMGTGGALRDACRFFGLNRAMVMNGDSYCELDFNRFLERHCARPAVATLALAQVPQVGRFGSVETDGADRIVAFREKSETTEAGWINAGIYLLEPEFLNAIPAQGAVSIERDVFSRTAAGLYGFRAHGKFIDIGTPESYALAEDFFAGRQAQQAQQQ